MEFYYRRIFHHEKNKFPGLISSVVQYQKNSNYDFEVFKVKNDITRPINLDDYELFIEELDRDRPILYDRLLAIFNMLESTPIVHFTDKMNKRKVYPGDRYAKLSLCIFSSVNEIISPLYFKGETDKLFEGANLFPLTRISHYHKKPYRPKAGRPKKK